MSAIGEFDDLRTCLDYHPQAFGVDDVRAVVAVREGEPDGPDWVWLLDVAGRGFIVLRGGCDYTGWDCQSWAEIASEGKTPAEAISHLDDAEVRAEFYRQALEGKDETTRERIGRELFGA